MNESPNTGPEAEKLSRDKGSFISHVATLTTGTAVSQGINILAMLLLTRIFAPQAFGLLALFMTCVSLFSVLGGARYELAIMLPEDDTEAVNVFYGSVFVLFLIALLGLAASALFHARITQLLGDPAVTPWLWAMPAVLFLMGLYQVLSYWCGRMKRFHRVAVSRIALTTGTVVAQVGLFLLHFSGGVALIGGWIIGQATGTSFLIAQVVSRDSRFLLRHARFSSVPGLLKTYRNFPLYKAPYSFISNAASQLVVVIIRFFCDLMTVGLFSLAFRAISLPVSLIASSMNQVFYEKAAREGDTARLESFVNRVLYIQVVLMTPMLVLAAFEAKLLFTTFFGARWAMSGQFASWLAFAGYMYFLTSWLDRLFDIRGRQRLSLGLDIVGNLFSLGALAGGLYLTGSALVGVAAFSISEVIYTCVWLYASYRVGQFRTAGLLRIAGAFVACAAPVLLMIGAIHLVLSGWAAFAVSLASVLLFEAVFSLRKVRAHRSLYPGQEGYRKSRGQKPSPNQRSEFALQCYGDCAAELEHIFPNQKLTRALEVGCCGGSLLSFLELPGCSYTGVDFNSQFLESLCSRYPRAAWKPSEPSSSAAQNGSCELIFSHSAVAHFDPKMLSRHLRNAKSLMNRKSVLICGSILDRDNRVEYAAPVDSGKGVACYVRCWVRLGKSYLRRILGMENLGHWYDRGEFSTIARLNGFEVSFVRSSACAYRFHAVLRLAQGAAKRTPGPSTPSVPALPLLAPQFAATRPSRFRAACGRNFRRESA